MASTKESATGQVLSKMRWAIKAGPIKKEHAFNMLFFSSLYSMSISQRLTSLGNLSLWNVASRNRCSWHSRCSRSNRCSSSRSRWNRRSNRGALHHPSIDRSAAVGARCSARHGRTDHDRFTTNDRCATTSGATRWGGSRSASTAGALNSSATCFARCRRGWSAIVGHRSSRALGRSTRSKLVEQTTTAAILGHRTAASCRLFRMKTRQQTASASTASVVSTTTGHRDRSKSSCYKRHSRQYDDSKLTHKELLPREK